MTPRRPRVLRIITRLNVGGPSHQALLLTDRLREQGFDTLLACGRVSDGEADLRDVQTVAHLPIIEVPSLGRALRPLNDARAFSELMFLIRRHRPDIVHTHLAKAGALGRVAAAVSRTRAIVHTFHGNVLRGYFDPLRSAAFLASERALARMSTAIVAISPRQRSELERLGIARGERLVEIPLGLELARFRAPRTGALRVELGFPHEPLVGIVARLVPIKRIDLFLRAAALVHASVPAARFVVVGDGELGQKLRALARDLGIEDATRFVGWRADLPEIYADLDVVTLTSRNEGFPVSLVEAMAAGRAVIATDVGGVGDLVRPETGILVPSGDVPALAAAIVGLIRDPARRATLARHAAMFVYPEHDAGTLVRRIASLYRRLLDR